MPRVKKEVVETPKAAVKAPKVAKVAPKKDTLALDVYDVKGKVVGSVDLPQEVFGTEVNAQLVAQAVRVYRANQRVGTASTKTRGEVQGSSRKIYKQKGTGRARHGSVRAPIFVHGGVVFGPKPRDYSLAMPKKMKKKALFMALSAKLKDGGIKVVAGLEKLTPKTKEMVSVLNNLSLNDSKKKILLVLPSSGTESVVKAIRNIEGVTYMPATHINTYEILNNRVVLFMKDALEVFSKKEEK